MTDYYVATTGSNANTGTSAANAWQTIPYASTKLKPGDTCHVQPGTYNTSGGMITSAAGTALARVVYISDVQWGAVVTSTGIDTVWDNRADYVDIVGFDITSVDASFGIYQRNSYGSFRKNRVHDMALVCSSNGGAGIEIGSIGGAYSGVYNDVIGNWVFNIGPTSACNFMHGIYPSCQYGNITNNVVFNCGAWGIHQYHNAGHQNISNNLCFGNRVGGIQITADGSHGFTSDYNTVNNNILLLNTSYGLQEYGPTGTHNTYSNNCYNGNGYVNQYLLQNGNTSVNHLYKIDPQLVNFQADGSGNYQLSSTSPCIDAGTASNAPATDFLGVARPQGAGYDIGPYEYTISVVVQQAPPPVVYVPPGPAVRLGIGTYQPLNNSAITSIGGGFPNGPGTLTNPYAGLYGGTYGYLLDIGIKQPQATTYTPAGEIGLDATGISVVRGYPQISWTYTTMRPDYWYYLQFLYKQSGKTPPGYQYLVLLQYPSWDGTNTVVQQLARMDPPTYSYRDVGAFYGVTLLFTYVGQAMLNAGTLVTIIDDEDN